MNIPSFNVTIAPSVLTSKMTRAVAEDSSSDPLSTSGLDAISGDDGERSKKVGDSDTAGGAGGGPSLAVITLQKRIKELEKQLQEQQAQLQAAASKKYSSDTEKTTALMAAQGQLAVTSASLSQATSQLSAELAKNPIRTTA
ncbi:hypothetical protein [Pseudomonas sp. ME-P-057]|uniref:hypothetical protein n=1 Tax=Pseudomonas sp. ME-P-057 TaxID=3040321 RepID=UPI00255539D4|nr:hypothetical protein [Pseudomonas sp. ME-P-057]